MEEDSSSNKRNLHAIMMPLSFQGHITPFTNLALKLASKGFTITFVTTQIIHHQITKSLQEQEQDKSRDIFSGARKSGYDIRYKTISDGFPLGFDRMSNLMDLVRGMMHVLPAHLDELIGDLVTSGDLVTCLIADSFYTWTSKISEKYKLVNVSFWTQPALSFVLYNHFTFNDHFASLDSRGQAIHYIPNIKEIKEKDLPSFFQSGDTNSEFQHFIIKALEDAKNADFVLANTVQELEIDTILVLQDKQPFYAIGPIFPSVSAKSIVPTSLMRRFDCGEWLDTKPKSSVLYVSFGSFIPSTKNDLDEIAHGLVLSKVNFLWVIRPKIVKDDQESYVPPLGFEDEVSDKGLIVKWCDQIGVLSHPSIGGFLTHCGWNSILESVWFGAVPLLCFPFMGDQPTNRKLVTNDWRIGVNLCDKDSLTRFEVAEKIKLLMNGKSAEDLRNETMKVRQVFENSIDVDGSSEKNLCKFISDLKAKIGTNVRH